MPIFRHKLSLSSLNCILICQLIILRLSCATSVDSIVLNGQPVASSSLSETLEFSDSIPGFEHHEFQSLRIKPLNAADNKLLPNSPPHNKSTVTKVTTSATLAATLLKKVGLPSTPKYAVYSGSANNNQNSHHANSHASNHHASNFNSPPSNKTILNSLLIKRINRQPPTSATLTASSALTTPLPYDDADPFRKPALAKAPGLVTANGKLLRLSKKKKAKQSTYKSVNSSSLLLPATTSPATIADIEDTNNELTSSSIAPNGVQATEQHSVLINHGGGAVSTIRRTLNTGSSPAFEHLQIGFPPSNNRFSSDSFPSFGMNVDLTPPPLPQIINHSAEPLNHQQPPAQSIGPAKPPPPPIQQPRDEAPLAKPIFSSNRNGRLRGAHKKQVHVNRRKSAALVKDNELNNQIVPVSVGLPNSFQNVKPADLPNFAELSFFGYRSEQNAPRSFNDREHYTTNNNNNNLNSNFNYNRGENGFNGNNNNMPPPPPPPPMNQPPVNGNQLNGAPRNEFNFNLHPFFANERRNQPPNNNDLYQFFDTPFMPINPPPPAPAIHNLNNIHFHTNHQTMHHHNGDNHQLNHQINHQIFHHQPIDNEIGGGSGGNSGAGPLHPINTPNGHFQRRKLTLSNGNTAPMVNEISNNNLGYGYPTYGLYKGDEEAGIKYPKIFKFVDGRVNLNDFEKEKKLGKIEFGKSVAEDGNEYQFEHVRRDLFLILHGGSFNY